jgi:hypothetical protein
MMLKQRACQRLSYLEFLGKGVERKGFSLLSAELTARTTAGLRNIRTC